MASSAKLILDSISTRGVRVVTFELTYPLIIHNEVLTYRSLWKTPDMQFDEWLDFSRSSSSNRAIAPARIREQVANDPYIPTFVAPTAGMVGGEELADQRQAAANWLWARDQALIAFDRFDANVRVHKQHRNRLLGPFQYITTVITGNAELWEHLFHERDHPSAQPDFGYVAKLAHELYRRSTAQVLGWGEWHMPYTDDLDCSTEDRMKISVARCARTSFLRQGESYSTRDDLRLYADLVSANPPHNAPREHILTPVWETQRVGNFVGWKPLRHA